VLWQAMRMQDDLIYDVGLHSGKDTEFYLAKGFRVVAIEANPVLATRCKTKFASQIKEGRLHILQLAIGEQAGNCDFFVCDQHDDWSTIDRRDRLKKEKQDGVTFRTVTVRCASLDTVLLEFGVPYYLKIDIEGCDVFCLEALKRTQARPKYVSVETDGYDQLFHLYLLGYNKFKVINQALHKQAVPPRPPREGLYVDATFNWDSSGLFGEETAGSWLGINDALKRCRQVVDLSMINSKPCPSIVDRIRRRRLSGRPFLRTERTWFDLHATL
jgi:FkbM family methyltransferase